MHDENLNIGRRIHDVSNIMHRSMARSRKKMECSIAGIRGFALCYLAENADRPVYQRDFEEEFNIRRSSVSALLKSMELCGLICRRPVESDKRLKQIVLTEKAKRYIREIEAQIDSMELALSADLTQAEIETFFTITDKIMKSLQSSEKREPSLKNENDDC